MRPGSEQPGTDLVPHEALPAPLPPDGLKAKSFLKKT